VMLVNMRFLLQETDQVVLLQEALRTAFDHYIQKLARNRGLSQEGAEAQAELDLPVEPDFQGIKRRPYVHYYVSFDGILQLSSRDDHSGGKIPYQEVAQLKLSDDSVYILAVLPLT